MNIDMLVTKLKLSGFDFMYPPGKSLITKFVRVGREKVGVYEVITSRYGYGLRFKFNSPKVAKLLAKTGESMKVSVFHHEQGVILYPIASNPAHSK